MTTTRDFSHRDRCAVAGIGATEFSKNSGRSALTMAIQATLAALADAGLAVDDVDGLVQCDHDRVGYNDLAEALGLRNLTYFGATGPGGVAPAGMVGQAVGAILSGQATTVVLYRSLNGRSGVRFGAGVPGVGNERVGGDQTWDEFFLPFGLVTPGQFFALLAQRHMTEHGTTSEQLGKIAVTCRQRANANPAAQMYDRKLSLEDYFNGRMISYPLRLFDFCLETDGACAVVVTSTERARDLRQPPAVIRAVAQGKLHAGQGGAMFPVLARTLDPVDVGRADGGDAVRAGRPRTCRHRRRPVLRLLHDHRADAARGLRVLPARPGRSVRRQRCARDDRIAADQHRRRQHVGGVHPRHEPRPGGRPPGARHVHVASPGSRDVPRHLGPAHRQLGTDPHQDRR